MVLFSCRVIFNYYNLADELDDRNNNDDDDDDDDDGTSSRYGPYIAYLKSQPRGIMPGEWCVSAAGRMFLASCALDDGRLPPYELYIRGGTNSGPSGWASVRAPPPRRRTAMSEHSESRMTSAWHIG